MNYTKSLLGSLAALAAGTTLLAQSAAPEAVSAGLLGQRYFGAGLFVEDLRDLPVDNAIGGEVGVNLPLTTSLDLGLSYGYAKLDDSQFNLRQHETAVTLRAYNPYEGVKLFSDATLGYSWNRIRSGLGRLTENHGFWSLGVGVEAPVAAHTALLGRVGYTDVFESGYEGSWTFTGGVSHHFTAKVSGLASVSFQEDDAVTYAVGVAIRF